MKHIKFNSFDGTVLQCYLWDEVKLPKGVVQISHGMAEHARRYDDFAKFLNSKGYIVFADDHRAHGNSEKKADIGYHAGDIFNDTVSDEIAITKYLKETYKLPVVYLGHSYGSFIGQGYLQRENEAEAVILVGTAKMPTAVAGAGASIAKMQYRIHGGKKPAKFMNKLSFSSYDKPFRKEGYPFAWLSRDVNQVKKYYDDEQCGYVMSIAFFKYFLGGVKNLYKPDNLAKINKAQPIAIFSGECDPVGGKKSKMAKDLYEMYKNIGVQNISIKVYPECRHEVLNEINKADVYNDMLDIIVKYTVK